MPTEAVSCGGANAAANNCEGWGAVSTVGFSRDIAAVGSKLILWGIEFGRETIFATFTSRSGYIGPTGGGFQWKGFDMSNQGSEFLADGESRSTTAAPHPEEMKGTVEFRLGRYASVTARGRATPAGLATAALLVATVLIPFAWLLRRGRR
jgi:hypothetical protein